jgi:hypothetical protein
MANKFATNLQVEEAADFQAWLDAQEVADIRAMEAEALASVRTAAAIRELIEWKKTTFSGKPAP